ncbi:hypothetical protein CC77DRAFT_788296 [Alternaria alternata]|uniref:Uncharacterized protein n=1 Tax=Alternaria alternata TaxID=5599 RepID=A0A177DRM7_ALTAL|nr:hypothetical protein CC77DRAFT_788296 [Alternaria alternata]OAG22157.1 hypothetical protein CC77DRAFT_788296 [Alternaria alternata]
MPPGCRVLRCCLLSCVTDRICVSHPNDTSDWSQSEQKNEKANWSTQSCYHGVRERGGTVVWYCCNCGDGPMGSWGYVCSCCSHEKCGNCAVEVAK